MLQSTLSSRFRSTTRRASIGAGRSGSDDNDSCEFSRWVRDRHLPCLFTVLLLWGKHSQHAATAEHLKISIIISITIITILYYILQFSLIMCLNIESDAGIESSTTYNTIIRHGEPLVSNSKREWTFFLYNWWVPPVVPWVTLADPPLTRGHRPHSPLDSH